MISVLEDISIFICFYIFEGDRLATIPDLDVLDLAETLDEPLLLLGVLID